MLNQEIVEEGNTVTLRQVNVPHASGLLGAVVNEGYESDKLPELNVLILILLSVYLPYLLIQVEVC